MMMQLRQLHKSSPCILILIAYNLTKLMETPKHHHQPAGFDAQEEFLCRSDLRLRKASNALSRPDENPLEHQPYKQLIDSGIDLISWSELIGRK